MNIILTTKWIMLTKNKRFAYKKLLISNLNKHCYKTTCTYNLHLQPLLSRGSSSLI
jgi:hypothetical protein